MTTYASHPDIPAARIHPYVKRRITNAEYLHQSADTSDAAECGAQEMCYLDFFSPGAAVTVAS